MSRAVAALPLLAALVVTSGGPWLWAQEIDDVLEGFEAADELAAEGPQEEQRERRFRLGGSLALGVSYNFAHRPPAGEETDWRGLSRLRTTLELESALRLHDHWRLLISGSADYDPVYRIRGRDEYEAAVLDAYESELELEESFLTGRLGRFVDLSVGRQIVAWGSSETLRVTDVLNPLDLREPGLTDVDELRLPVAMTRLDWSAGRWRLSAMAIHEIRFDNNPVSGHDFYPAQVPLPEEQVPSSNLDTTELAVALSGAFEGWDLSLHWAELWDDRPHLELVSPWQPQLVHNRVTMYGATADLARGDFLLKAEAAHFRGLEFFATAQ